MISLDLIRQETVEATRATEIDPAVAGLQTRVGLELLTHQSVVECEALCLLTCQHLVARLRVVGSRLISDDAPLRREPQGTVVLDDAHDVATGHFEADAIEAIPLGVVAAEAVERAYPQLPSLVHQRTVHLVAGQRCRVFVVVQILFEPFVLDAAASRARDGRSSLRRYR